MSISKLVLGTVQFGVAYGVANIGGKVPPHEVRQILSLARQNSVMTIDTAIAYGDSETELGRHEVSGFDTITKLSECPESENPMDWGVSQVQESLSRLNLNQLYGVLLHRPGQLTGPKGADIYGMLLSLKEQGLVQKIGISVYGPEELEQLSGFDFDIYQAPFSILDTRMLDTGWLARIHQQGAEFHARSAFLQGLLLMRPEQRPEKFSRWQHIWNQWDTWLQETGVTPVVACLQFVLQQPLVDRVIVGVDSAKQWQELLAASGETGVRVPQLFENLDEILLNPSQWEKI